MAKTIELNIVPATVTIENTSTEEATSFRYFRVNFTEILEAEDTVILTATTSEELAYYLALADEAKHIAVTAVAAE